MPSSSSHRLKKNADFLHVLRGRTKKFEGIFGRMVVAGGRSSVARFGFVVSKKASPRSTERNLLKRRASEWVRKRLPSMRAGFDVIFIFEKGATSLSRRILYEELERACKRAGLFQN